MEISFFFCKKNYLTFANKIYKAIILFSHVSYEDSLGDVFMSELSCLTYGLEFYIFIMFDLECMKKLVIPAKILFFFPNTHFQT